MSCPHERRGEREPPAAARNAPYAPRATGQRSGRDGAPFWCSLTRRRPPFSSSLGHGDPIPIDCLTTGPNVDIERRIALDGSLRESHPAHRAERPSTWTEMPCRPSAFVPVLGHCVLTGRCPSGE